jgi:abortive infection bacteriophage resistance protein
MVSPTIPATLPVRSAHPGGFSFIWAKMKFDKPPLSVSQHLDLMRVRGLAIPDTNKAAHYLRYIGYYRLSGYALPLTFKNHATAPSHNFKPGTCFDDILNLYLFDRDLRLLVMDAIERIEVAFRTCFSNVMCGKFGSHWYMNASHFLDQTSHEDFAKKVIQRTGYAGRSVRADAKGKEVFLQHYFGKYHEPELPPAWMIVEVLPISALSLAFENIKLREHKKTISMEFGLNPEVLESWIHAVSYVRNLCAHHSRLWNREFTIRPMMSREINGHVPNNNRFFAQAFVINFLLKKVSPNSTWWERFCKLVKDNPFIDPIALGASHQWCQNPN